MSDFLVTLIIVILLGALAWGSFTLYNLSSDLMNFGHILTENGGTIIIDKRWIVSVFKDGTITGYDGDRLVGVQSSPHLIRWVMGPDKFSRTLIVEKRCP